jgi:hypothetical protein
LGGRRRAIPPRLWERVVELVEHYPETKIASRLRINRESLQRQIRLRRKRGRKKAASRSLRRAPIRLLELTQQVRAAQPVSPAEGADEAVEIEILSHAGSPIRLRGAAESIRRLIGVKPATG